MVRTVAYAKPMKLTESFQTCTGFIYGAQVKLNAIAYIRFIPTPQ